MPQNGEMPKIFSEGQEYRLRVDKANEVPPGNECYVSVVIQGHQYEAFVPVSTVVSKEPPIISGKMVGTFKTNILISFSPSSMGTSIWTIPPEDVEKIKVGVV